MNPFIQCLNEDHKASVEAWLDTFTNATENLKEMDLPLLKPRYLVEDYEDLLQLVESNQF